MFFLEVTVLGACVDKLSFLVKITKYVKNWMRSALYIMYVCSVAYALSLCSIRLLSLSLSHSLSLTPLLSLHSSLSLPPSLSFSLS